MKHALLPLLLMVAVLPTWAAKADRQRPLIIQGGDGMAVVSQTNERAELIGPVTVTQGSLLMRASKLVWTQRPDATNQVLAGTRDGTAVQFSQALEKPGERREGQADEIDYDERTGLVRFIGNARVRMLAGAQMQRELTGSQISFDTNKEELRADGELVGKPGGNVRIVIMPKVASAPEAAKPAALQTSPALKPQ